MTLYVLTILLQSMDSHDVPEVFTAVFSTEEKAFASVVDFCRKNWRWGNDEIEMPANDGDIVTQFFENVEDGDYYEIQEQEIDGRSRCHAKEKERP